ncbi:MAG: aldo/keto reductase [Promethearchaeota archaeon]
MQKGAIPIPKASSLDHLRDNFESTEITLSSEEIQQIDAISHRERFVYPPVVAPKKWKSDPYS